MSESPFSPEVRRALDSFAPPPLPPGFADRVRDKARARSEVPAPPLPRLSRRWRSANPWLRAGWIAGGVAGLSLMSAAAAATGVFGKPVHIPVISQIARSLDIVPAAASSPREVAEAGRPVERVPVAKRPVRERLDALLDDPEFRSLPRVERRVELRRTAREIVDAGEATPREVVVALRESGRERIANLPPEQQERIARAVERRQELRREAIAKPPLVRRLERRQTVRERLADWRERRLEQLDGEPQPTPPPADPEPAGVDAEGSEGS